MRGPKLALEMFCTRTDTGNRTRLKAGVTPWRLSNFSFSIRKSVASAGGAAGFQLPKNPQAARAWGYSELPFSACLLREGRQERLGDLVPIDFAERSTDQVRVNAGGVRLRIVRAHGFLQGIGQEKSSGLFFGPDVVQDPIARAC